MEGDDFNEPVCDAVRACWVSLNSAQAMTYRARVGAGGAAHAPGMVAAFTSLPVIGVPIKAKAMEGLDSLLSIVQMPSGIPVATVGINSAKNAGILAAQIIGVSDKAVQKKVDEYKDSLKNSVIEKAEKLEKIGYQKYLNESTKNS